MIVNMIGSFIRNYPFGTELAFSKGLKQLGVEVYEWDPSRTSAKDCELKMFADATIIFKEHGNDFLTIVEALKKSGQMMIEYQPDDIRAPGIREMMRRMNQYCDYAFTFDESGARVAKELGYKDAQKLLVTADPDVYRPLNDKKSIDLCFVGSLSNPNMHVSRRKMIDILIAKGYQVEHHQNMFDPFTINDLYNKSKIVLNHATDVGQGFGFGYGYQCRHFEAALSRCCLLSNAMLDEVQDGPKEFCQFNSKEGLLDAVEVLLNGWYDGPVYETQGELFYKEVMAKHLPIHRAQEIVDFINNH